MRPSSLRDLALRAPIAAGVAALAVLAGGCSEETVGSPEPPKAFGPRATAWFGCPSMQGVYAWPPVAGEWSDGVARGRQPWAGGVPLPIYAQEMQVWVRQSSSGLVLQGRSINRRPNVRDRMALEWSHVEYAGGRCTSGMLELAGGAPGAARDRGGDGGVADAFRLARLADGALAVGLKTVERGRTGTIFSWGDQSHGSYPLPDRVHWRWSKLAKLDSGEREPAPVDASTDPSAARP